MEMLLIIQVVTVFLASVAMSLAVAHALELPGKMRLSKENYLVTQTIYYPGFTIGGIGEAASAVAALILLLLTPTDIPAFWWTLAGFVGLVAMQVVYWILTHPVNKFWVKDLDLKGVSAGFFAFESGQRSGHMRASIDDRWVSLRNRWEYSHVLRAMLSATSLISLTVAVALRGNN
jgi:hypothetical protein